MCAVLKNVSDWHSGANFVISKPPGECKVLKRISCEKRPKVRPSYCIFCFFDCLYVIVFVFVFVFLFLFLFFCLLFVYLKLAQYQSETCFSMAHFSERHTMPMAHVSERHATRIRSAIVQRFSRAGPRGRAREWATLRVHPLSWLLSNNHFEEVCGTLKKGTLSSRLLLSNQDKGCTPSVAHSLPLPLPLPPGFPQPVKWIYAQVLIKQIVKWARFDITANLKSYKL